MDKQIDQFRRTQFSRRALLLLGAQAGVMGALGLRLYQLQVLESDAHFSVAEENRINQAPIPPVRGEIFDRSGAPLARNTPNYRLRLVREVLDPETGERERIDVPETIDRLRRLIALSDDELTRLEKRLSRTRAFVPVLLRENLTWDEFALVNANAPALIGVEPELTWSREYPSEIATASAHILGYVAAVTEEDLRADRTGDRSLRLPEARIGKNGVEKAAEPMLRGQAGLRKFVIDAAGRERAEIERIEGEPGRDLGLTIDAGLQNYAMRRLAGESAAAIVMDVWSGDLLAMASAPAYDPNKFVRGISHADWDALRNDEYDPLRNKAVAGAYPPGSTFKMITALAALEAGMPLDETITCRGKMTFGDRDFHCWKREGHGKMDLFDAIKHSCDIHFYEAAFRAGIDRIAEMAGRFGLGERFDLEIPNLNRGVIPTRDWKRANHGEDWRQGETLITGIGQGFVLTTPLQLATMTARIANGRERVRPRLIRSINGAPAPLAPREPLGVAPEHLDVIRRGMEAVSNESGGTAFRSQIADPENRLAGKTGTSQVYSITPAEREAGVREYEDLPWRLRDHALFVAYAPAQTPRYAVAVVVEHGGGGSKAAAPVARDIMMRALYGTEPPLEAYPTWIREELEEQRAAPTGEPNGENAPEIRGFGDVATTPESEG